MQKITIFIHLFSLPWNQNCVAGWLAEQVFSAFYAGAYLFVISAFLTFFIGISMHHSALTSFIQEMQTKIAAEIQRPNLNRKEVEHLLRVSIDTYNLGQEYERFSLFIVDFDVCCVFVCVFV